MLRFLAARGRAAAACVYVVGLGLAYGSPAAAQTWNDSRTLALVTGAAQRRAEQLADTGLVDYRATAHGYVTFLAQLGEGLRTPPKVIKADELALEVYWHAPNLSKQRIVGRRDTLLLPTDIAYHRDHLGIVQNNFPNIIRIGDGDEVADVPHPLSPAGLGQYDFALSDSFAIGAGSQRIRVYEIKVRPKDDRKPRIVGALYIDPSGGQVVRMNFGFTRAAFLDNSLEQLSIVSGESAGRRALLAAEPATDRNRAARNVARLSRARHHSRTLGDRRLPIQHVDSDAALRRSGNRAGDAAGPARVPLDGTRARLAAARRARGIRAGHRARAVGGAAARARAGARARSGSDVVGAATSPTSRASIAPRDWRSEPDCRSNLAPASSASVRARYGAADRLVKGDAEFGVARADGSSIRAFASRDYRELGDVAERSMAVNSLAAQEFASDYTDPYLVRAAGLKAEARSLLGLDATVTGALEWQSPVSVRATPVTGTFQPTVPVADQHVLRWALDLDRPPSLWMFGTELTMHAQARLVVPQGPQVPEPSPLFTGDLGSTLRGSLVAQLERPFGETRLVTSATVAGVGGQNTDLAPQRAELVYLGGPVSAPGYNFHSLVSDAGATAHLEWQLPAPFIPFSLGRFGHVPAQGAIAPYAHFALLGEQPGVCVSVTARCPSSPQLYPALGAAYLLPFNVLRIDVARGVARGGRWTFGVDVSREFWSIF